MKKLTPEQVNWLYPVHGFYYHKNGIEIVRRARLESGKMPEEKQEKRGKIASLSKRSLHKLAFLVATSAVEFLSLLTLTYGSPYPKNGRIVRSHRNTFLTWLRRVYGKVDYVWFLEFQERGAPHFHVLLSIKAPSDEKQIRAGRAWVKIASATYPKTREKMLKVATFVGEEEGRIWQNIRQREGALRYMRKYAGKEAQKTVPKAYTDVGRFWGASRNTRASDDEREYFRTTEQELRDLIRVKGRKDVAEWQLLPKYVHT